MTDGILQILRDPILLSGILLVFPVLVLVAYVVLDRIASKTATKVDDEVAAGLGEILQGLGKPLPPHIEASQAKQLEDLHNGIPASLKISADDEK